MELNRFYPSRCHTMDFPCCFSWELQNQTDILPQMEFECFVYVGYISPKERARTADDTNIFMTDVPPVGITVRRAKVTVNYIQCNHDERVVLREL